MAAHQCGTGSKSFALSERLVAELFTHGVALLALGYGHAGLSARSDWSTSVTEITVGATCNIPMIFVA